MSQRQKQVESLLQRAVASVLQRGLADPRIKGLVSITRVDVSPDLKSANVLVSIMPENHESATLHGLQAASHHIQQQIKKLVALRQVPHIRFKLDQDLKKQAAVLAAINEGMQRTAASGPVESPDPDAAADADASPDHGTDSDSDSDAPDATAEAPAASATHPDTPRDA